MILPGVTIGDGAIVAAHSVVARDVEPYTVVGGNPTRFLKKRFREELIQFLLQLRWWDFPPEKLVEILPLLCDTDLEQAEKKLESFLDP